MRMNSDQNPLEAEEWELIHPRHVSPGLVVALAKRGSRSEILELQASGVRRVWTIQAVIGSSIPLSGAAASTMQSPGVNNISLRDDPLSIYLHSGGHSAIYYDLRADHVGSLTRIEVHVESELPSNALLLARRPINALLDVLTRDSHLPLLIQRLELLSPNTGNVLICECLWSQGQQLVLGPLGGIHQAVPFAPYDAIYREALTSTSPFYRLLCAARIFEGTGPIRKWLKVETQNRGTVAQMPGIPKVDKELILGMGLPNQLVENVNNVQQLYDKLLQMRNAVAHFLVKQGEQTGHVYLADGFQLRAYSAAAASLLFYSHEMLGELKLFYTTHLPRRGSQILPTHSHRDKFIVRAKDYGLK